MTKRTAQQYQRALPKDQRGFDSWLNSNAILSSIFAVGMLAMALAGIGTIVSDQSAKGVIAVVPTPTSGEPRGDLVDPISAVFTTPGITESKKEKINQ